MPVSIYKPIGQTPNELIEVYKKEHKQAKKDIFFVIYISPLFYSPR